MTFQPLLPPIGSKIGSRGLASASKQLK